MEYVDNLVIGAGIAGISTAYHLGEYGHRYLIVDRREPGGLCSTISSRGFLFDITGHVIHSRTSYYRNFVKGMLGNNLLHMRRKAYFIFERYLIPYPFQLNFYRIPLRDIVDECINGLIDVARPDVNKVPMNFEEWIFSSFGRGISKHFMVPYNEKLWRFPLRKMSLDWVRKYVPRPDPEYILRIATGASPNLKEHGYNVEFLYPKLGGIQSVIDAIVAKMGDEFELSFRRLQLDMVDIVKKTATLSDGTEVKWNNLISTIPLSELVTLISSIPDELKSLAQKLKYTSMISVNLGVKGKLENDAHWIYFPERNVPYHRVVIQTNLSPHVSPDSSYSLIVEKSLRPCEHYNVGNVVDHAVSHLLRSRLIRSRKDILVIETNPVKYAYPIYDVDWFRSKPAILKFLERYAVYSVGRFGRWEYLSMEDAFLQGKDAAMHIAKDTI